jgi:hypothetical protein
MMLRPAARRPAAAALLALSLAVLAGCGDGDDSAGAPTATATVTESTSESAGTSPSASTSSSPSPSQPAQEPTEDSSGPATTDAGATPLCATPDLEVQVKPAEGGGAAGTTHQTISFTNRGEATCTIDGHPGVSYVKGRTQVGAAADRTGDPTSVTLEPHGVATADLAVSDPGNYGDECRPTPVDKLKIFPPDNRQAQTMRIQATGCAAESVHLLTVGPVTQGS